MGLDNAYNINPSTGRAHGVEPYPGGMPIFYANGVSGLRLCATHLCRPVPLPAGWNAEKTVLLNVQNLITDSACA